MPLLALLLLTFQAAADASFTEPFDGTTAWRINRGDERGGAFAITAAPQLAKPAGELSWQPQHHHFLEVSAARPLPLTDLGDAQATLDGQAIVRLGSRGAPEVSGVGLRLVDAKGEVFQWSQSVNLGEAGWQELHFDLRPDSFRGHWGGGDAATGQIQMPVRLQGLAVTFHRNAPAQADPDRRRLWVDHLTIRPNRPTTGDSASPAAPAQTQAQPQATVLADFESGLNWRVHRGEERGGELALAPAPPHGHKPGGQAAELRWSAQRDGYLELFAQRPLALPMLGGPEAALAGEVTVQVFSPGTSEVTSLTLRLRDAKGETFEWAQRVNLAEPGWQAVRFELKPDSFRGSWGPQKTGQIQMPLQLLGLAVNFHAQAPIAADPAQRRLLFDDLTVIATGAPETLAPATARPDAIALTLETGHPLSLIDPTQPAAATLALHNTAAEAFAGELRIRAQSYSGRELRFAFPIALAPDQRLTRHVGLPLDRADYWDLHHELTSAQGRTTGRNRLAVMQPAGPAPALAADGSQAGGDPPFLLGVCAHTERFSPQAMELEALAAGVIGMRIVRGGPSWGRLQPQADTLNFESMDHLLRLYGEQGVRYQYLIAFTPRWASTAAPDEPNWLIWSRMPPRIDAWGQFVRAMAERYRPFIRDWEMWNEPDLTGFFRGTPEDYLAMMERAYAELKAVDPEFRVFTGGFATAKRNRPFIETVLERGRDHYDVLAWHAHSAFQPFVLEVDGALQEIRDRLAPDKALYFNETGLPSMGDDRVIERVQAEAVIKKIALAWARGAVGYSWYNLRDSGPEPNNAEHRFGLITEGFQPKPSYVVYNAFSALLGQARFVETIDLGRDAWVFVFETPEGYAVLSWAEAGNAVGHLILEAPDGTASVRDAMGHEAPATVLPGGRHVVPIGMEPAFWVLRGENLQAPQARGRLVEVAAPPLLVPGEARPIPLRVRNPLATPETLQLRLSLPATLGGGFEEQTANLAPGAEHTFEFRIPLAGDLDLPGGADIPGQLHYRSRSGLLQGELTLPLRSAHRLAPPDRERRPDFVLDHRSRVVNLFDADPNSVHHQWAGPKDLSARVWVSGDARQLVLRVAVTDDQHHQPFGESELWRGDSVQLALQVPGQGGLWELSFARGEQGQALTALHLQPPGQQDPRGQVQLRTEPTEGGMNYEMRLPFGAFGITPEALQAGLALSLLVNDNDGAVRKGWIELTPGIGQAKDPSYYLRFVPGSR